jgi:hypothetical protein
MTANTPRARTSPQRRRAIFSEHCTAHNVALCCLCGKPIHRHNDRWIIEHKRALALLGPDTNTNCGPAHFACAEEKTHTQDLPRIRKAKRQQEAGQVRSAIDQKSRRGFTVPAGAIYDWKQRRYRAASLRVENAAMLARGLGESS